MVSPRQGCENHANFNTRAGVRGDHSSPGHNMAGLQPSRKTAKYAAILKLISAGGFAPGACARPRADAPSGFKKRWSGGTQSRNPGKRLRGKI